MLGEVSLGFESILTAVGSAGLAIITILAAMYRFTRTRATKKRVSSMLKRITVCKTALDLEDISDEINDLFTSDKIDHSDYNVLTQSIDRKKEKLRDRVSVSNITGHRPPADAKGDVRDDGYEWIQHPSSSGKWWFRIPDSDEWNIWED